MHRLDQFGLSAKDITFDFSKVIKRSRKVAKQLSDGVKFLMKKHGVSVFDGQGRLDGPGKVSVQKDGKDAASLSAANIILATGARARELPNLKPDGKVIWTYKEAMVPETMPKSLLVVGSGAIGIEFASFYRTLGAEVTVIEVLDRILPVEDEEISAFAHKAFIKDGMTIHTGATVKSLTANGAAATALVDLGNGKSETLSAERVILAVGITGNVEDIGLDSVSGVSVEKGHVVVNEWLETGANGVYAIGDLVGPPWLAHKAMHEGVICVEHLSGQNDTHPMNPRNIPGCTYCRPQIASLGLTEAQAKEAGHEVKVGRFPFLANGKAIAMGDAEGLVKTVFDAKTGELLGAHMIGAEVTELIQGYGIAKTLELPERVGGFAAGTRHAPGQKAPSTNEIQVRRVVGRRALASNQTDRKRQRDVPRA